MTASFLPPVIPTVERAARTATSPAGAGRRPPPLPAVHPGAAPTATVYALCAVDNGGRLADRSILRVLDWTAGRRLDIREGGGIVLARAAADGAHGIDGRGFLHLPLTVRRWCALSAGGRLLVAANPTSGVLIGYPIPVLDRLLADAHTPAGGDQA